MLVYSRVVFSFHLASYIVLFAHPCNKSLRSEACIGNEGSIKNNSCIEEAACYNNGGDVETGSCKGYEACLYNEGGIGKDSWYVHHFIVCQVQADVFESYPILILIFSTLSISDAFEGLGVCVGNTGDIGDGSCIEEAACYNNGGDVESGSCKGYEACLYNEGGIGKDSWYVHHFIVCQVQADVFESYPILILIFSTLSIGDAFEGLGVCAKNTGDIGERSCLGPVACLFNEGDVGNDSW